MDTATAGMEEEADTDGITKHRGFVIAGPMCWCDSHRFVVEVMRSEAMQCISESMKRPRFDEIRVCAVDMWKRGYSPMVMYDRIRTTKQLQ